MAQYFNNPRDRSRRALLASWTPAAFGTALKWWMDPTHNLYSDTGTTPVVVDDSISGWVCRAAAANRFDQFGGSSPQYKVGANGKSFVRFDATTKFLQKVTPSGLPSGNSPRSFSLGLKASSGRYAFAYGLGAPNNAYALDVSGLNTDGRIVGFANDYTIAGIQPATSLWLVIDGTYDGDTLSLRIDGGTPVTQATSDFNTTGDLAQINRFVNIDGGAVMDMTHLIMTNTVMSAAELNANVAFIQESFPSNP